MDVGRTLLPYGCFRLRLYCIIFVDSFFLKAPGALLEVISNGTRLLMGAQISNFFCDPPQTSFANPPQLQQKKFRFPRVPLRLFTMLKNLCPHNRQVGTLLIK